MRFNAVIAATILAVTVSGAALPQPAANAVAERDLSASEVINFVADSLDDVDEDDFDLAFEKRDPKYTRWHPAKRKAEAKGGKYTRPKPAGASPMKREAEADPKGGKYTRPKPAGASPMKREAEAEAEADPKGGKYTRPKPAGASPMK